MGLLKVRQAETVKDVQRSRDALALSQARTLYALADAYMHRGEHTYMMHLASAMGGLSVSRDALEADLIRLRALS